MATYCVGVTGGVASGKSEVTRRFEGLGVFVADADHAARVAVAPGSAGLAEIVSTFGSGVLDDQGALDRAAMRRLVFENAAARTMLEGIVHPHVRAQLQVECAQSPGEYAIAAIPLLAEGGGRARYPWLDRILVVDVSVEVQHSRLMLRDGSDAALASRMIAAQATRHDRLAIADDIIVNDGTLQSLEMHVAALDRRYRVLAREHQVAR